MNIEGIAHICHEANRALCLENNDQSQPSWEYAPEWQKRSAIDHVTAIQEGRVTTPQQLHENWFDMKQAEGWKYGAEKNAATLEHPCMLAFDELPEFQQAKDKLFFAIVQALS